MYARFWHKFLYDLGRVPTAEPFRRLVNQGMIQGVIETIYLAKERKDGRPRFFCAELVPEDQQDRFIRVPVLIDYVRDYGSEQSYLDEQSLRQFIEWRPEYRDAVFECTGGVFEHGVFSPHSRECEGAHLLTHSEVGKMSKSKFNVINPDDVVAIYGADCFRMYEMFLGPIEQSKPWDTKGIDGVAKFLKRFWALYIGSDGQLVPDEGEPTREMQRILHTAIRKVRDDMARLSLNTCVSHFMICVNELRRTECRHREILLPLIRLIAPFAPHLAEELWERTGGQGSVHHARYPEADPALLVSDEVTYPVSINGKKRAELVVPQGSTQEFLEQEALALPEIRKWLDGLTVRKMIVVPGRMINIVAG